MFDIKMMFFSLQIIAFDELKTDYKNPIDQCNSLNPLVLPEYILHLVNNLTISSISYLDYSRMKFSIEGQLINAIIFQYYYC